MKRNHTSAEIREYILTNVESNPGAIGRLTSEKFSVSRQSIHRYLVSLVRESALRAEGTTKNKQYYLQPKLDRLFNFDVTPLTEEDHVWRKNIQQLVTGIKENVVDICHYGFTEMVNNIVDHSGSSTGGIHFILYYNKVEMWVIDNGVGIFKKIAKELHLEDERHAVLELSKGKLTTDREHHSGEGLFFTSKMFDFFSIFSGSLCFTHTQHEEENWLLENKVQSINGTTVYMSISTESTRTTKAVFDKYASSENDYSFTRTHVPVALSRYGEEQLVSRSQAKRLLARLEPFKEVFLDFKGVNFIGQAFADEIFRVFRNEHPDIEIIHVNVSQEIEKMINRAKSSSVDQNQFRLDM